MGLAQGRYARLWWPGLALLAGLAVAGPLLLRPLPATHDGLHHLFRLFQLDQALRSWSLYPRIFADMGFGYGYPVLNYYSPLAYYVAWVATALGSGYLGGIKIAHALGLALGAVAMYGWVHQSFSQRAALLAAVAYSAFPYRIADVYVRGALAESLAFVFPPLLLWLGTSLVRRGQARTVPALALAAAGFVLTHHLTAFMFAPVVATYLVAEVGWPSTVDRRRTYLRVVAAAAVGVGLSAFFWLPALTEVRYVLAGQVGGEADLVGRLQPLSQWLSPYPLHRYFPYQGTAAEHPLGLVQVLVAIGGAAALVVHRSSLSRPARLLAALSVAIAAACALLLLPLSAPAWERLPLLHYLQFPWRLQAVLTLVTAVLAAGNGLWWSRRRLGAGLVAAVAAATVVGGLGGLTTEPAHMPGNQAVLSESDISQQGLIEYDFQTALWLREHGGEWLLEYLPVWALPRRSDFFLPAAPESAEPRTASIREAAVLSAGPLSLDLRLTLDSPGSFTWHRFYFPGWTVTADGQPVAPRPGGPLGLLTVDLPAGEQRVELGLGYTEPIAWGAAVAAASVAVVVGWSWLYRRRLLLGLAVSVALVLALVAGRAHAYPTTRSPMPVDAALDQTIKLVAYDAAAHGPQLEVTLYWLALQSPDRDYRVFVHALDAEGNLVAQHDGQPGLEFSPTTRWMAGEMVIDRHYLSVPQSPVTLYTGMYTLPEVRNLPVVQGGADVPDGRVTLGQWSPQ